MNAQHDLTASLREINSRWLQLARCGEFTRAWHLSDEALAARSGLDCSQWPRHQQFIWRGDDLRGRRVLVRCYHGLGDTIQFVRFVPRVRALAAEVVLWAQPPLIPLLQSQHDGAHRILPLHDGVPDVDFDVELELFELMHALRIPLEDVSAPTPYLLAESSSPCARSSQRRRVGLVWRAGEWNGARSIPCELLAALKKLSRIDWVLLQRGPALGEWKHDFGFAPVMKDMLEEAREMRRLDLLITVDTCSAHLAGALGVPVWTLLPHAADWRWMSDRSDTPWYPSMRLIRQRVPGDWHAVIAQLMAQLENWK